MKTSNIVSLDDYRPHIVSKVICLNCRLRWIAVRPVQTPLEYLECSNCGAGHVIETGEQLDNLQSSKEVDLYE